MDPFPGTPPGLWDRMAGYLRGIDASLGERPASILVISGHWEAPAPTVNTAEHPSLLYDYSGFPAHTYRLTYPAPGSPALAARVRGLLSEAGIPSDASPERGLDHGVFIPFKVMYPDADVPVVQLSLNRNRDAAAHLALGRALAPLRDESVLIVGSGMSYHNLRDMFIDRPDTNRPSEEFDRWLLETVTAADPGVRWARLAEWRDAPGARASHPTPEHLLPLMVAAGAGVSDRGVRTYTDRLLGKMVSAFQFG